MSQAGVAPKRNPLGYEETLLKVLERFRVGEFNKTFESLIAGDSKVDADLFAYIKFNIEMSYRYFFHALLVSDPGEYRELLKTGDTFFNVASKLCSEYFVLKKELFKEILRREIFDLAHCYVAVKVAVYNWPIKTRDSKFYAVWKESLGQYLANRDHDAEIRAKSSLPREEPKNAHESKEPASSPATLKEYSTSESESGSSASSSLFSIALPTPASPGKIDLLQVMPLQESESDSKKIVPRIPAHPRVSHQESRPLSQSSHRNSFHYHAGAQVNLARFQPTQAQPHTVLAMLTSDTRPLHADTPSPHHEHHHRSGHYARQSRFHHQPPSTPFNASSAPYPYMVHQAAHHHPVQAMPMTPLIPTHPAHQHLPPHVGMQQMSYFPR